MDRELINGLQNLWSYRLSQDTAQENKKSSCVILKEMCNSQSPSNNVFAYAITLGYRGKSLN